MDRREYLGLLGSTALAGTASADTVALSNGQTRDYLLHENFDSLSDELKPAVDESIDESVLGWTHTPPAGWEVTLAPDMPQGTTEWQGWSFTTREFWTAAAGQGRGEFTRGQGVIAVADPDEWDDTGSPASEGEFDSTLVSESIDLSGQGTVYLGFATHYRQWGSQTAEVTVSFDGGPDQTVLRYDEQPTSANEGGDVLNAYPIIEISVPDGVDSMVFKWRLYDAGNAWYWAIDDVRVAAESFDAPPVPDLPDVEVPDGPDGISTRKALVLGADGVRPDILAQADTPNLDSLIAEGAYSDHAMDVRPTYSGPNWTSIMTGVQPERHEVLSNYFGYYNRSRYPDFLTRLEQVNSDFSTFSVTDWAPLATSAAGGPLITDAVDAKVTVDASFYGWAEADAQSARVAATYIAEQNPDATFVYFGLVDVMGHNYGVGPEYISAIEAVDAHIGRIMDAVQRRPTYDEEDWLLLFTSDHGHYDSGGHGGPEPVIRHVPFLAHGPTVQDGEFPVTPDVFDTATTALGHMGVVDQSSESGVVPVTDLDGADLVGECAPGLCPDGEERPAPLFDSLETAYDNNGITADSNPASGNLDGGGNSFSAQALADAGLKPGSVVTHDGVTVTWPDEPFDDYDNVQASGEWIEVDQSGQKLGFFGSGTGGSGDVTVVYRDGTHEQHSITFPNWVYGPGNGAEVVAATDYRNTPEGPANHAYTYYVYFQSVSLQPGKTVEHVELPLNPEMHFFAMGISGDTTDEGYTRDLTGDGEVTRADLRAYAERMDDPAFREKVEKFDYNENGRIDHDDLVELARHL